MWFVERVFVPIEDQYKYLTDEDDDTDDEEWCLGPKKKEKKKQNETIAVSTGKMTILISPRSPRWCATISDHSRLQCPQLRSFQFLCFFSIVRGISRGVFFVGPKIDFDQFSGAKSHKNAPKSSKSNFFGICTL